MPASGCLIGLLVALAMGCSGSAENTSEPEIPAASEAIGERPRAAVTSDDPLYSRVEGIGVNNRCVQADDCRVTGCAREVCAAEPVSTECEVRPWPPQNAQCGCVDGQCIWYH